MRFLIAALNGEAVPPEDPQWDELLVAADFHRVTPHVARAAKSWDVPADIEHRLQARTREVASQNLNLFAHSANITELLRDGSIDSIVLKGPVLAHQLYGDLSMRVCSDVDILVPAADFTRAARMLSTQGYTCDVAMEDYALRAHLATQHDLAFAHADGTLIELHADIAQPHYSYRVDLVRWFERAATIEIAGRRVNCLSPEDSLVFGIVHGTKHLWSRLDLIADVGAQARQDLDWNAVRRELSVAGATRAAAVAGYLHTDFLNRPTPLLVADRTAAKLGRRTAARLRRQEDLSPCQARTFDFMVRERTRDGLGYVRRALQRMKSRLK